MNGTAMKRQDVQIGSTYIAKVSGVLAKVRISGWRGKILATAREVRIRSAARLRRPADQQ